MKFRLKLIKVTRKMTNSDEFYLHQQMKIRLYSLNEEIEPPLTIFNLLIEEGLIGPDDTNVLIEAFFGMKRHEILAIIREIEPPRTHIKSRSQPHIIIKEPPQLTEKFIYDFCSEELGPNDLLPLGHQGLKLPQDVIKQNMREYKITLDASLAIFASWKNYRHLYETNFTATEAIPPFTTSGLVKALKDANLTSALKNVRRY